VCLYWEKFLSDSGFLSMAHTLQVLSCCQNASRAFSFRHCPLTESSVVLLFFFLSLLISFARSLPREAVFDAAGVLSDSGFVSMALTLEVLPNTSRTVSFPHRLCSLRFYFQEIWSARPLTSSVPLRAAPSHRHNLFIRRRSLRQQHQTCAITNLRRRLSFSSLTGS